MKTCFFYFWYIRLPSFSSLSTPLIVVCILKRSKSKSGDTNKTGGLGTTSSSRHNNNNSVICFMLYETCHVGKSHQSVVSLSFFVYVIHVGYNSECVRVCCTE
eukprot:GHVS01031417.1.p1 GENE.GHVS01031417.1~~GHVS01031417.1.p1  ORF type:complete len:103 (-),score=17.19 GHVS01031417.1:182-490(-)